MQTVERDEWCPTYPTPSKPICTSNLAKTHDKILKTSLKIIKKQPKYMLQKDLTQVSTSPK